MKIDELIKALRGLKVETGSLACQVCGYERNCSIHGCAIINEAVERITMLEDPFSEGTVLKMAAAVLETTPEELRQSTRFHAGDTVWVLMRDEDDVPCDIGGYMFLAVAETAVIVTAFIGDYCGAISALPEAFFFGYSGAIFERSRSPFIVYSGAKYTRFPPKIAVAQKALF